MRRESPDKAEVDKNTAQSVFECLQEVYQNQQRVHDEEGSSEMTNKVSSKEEEGGMTIS